MACRNCEPISALRPTDLELARYAKPCEHCQNHDWVKVPQHNYEIFCKKCRVAKRKVGVNPPCPGSPPWADLTPSLGIPSSRVTPPSDSSVGPDNHPEPHVDQIRDDDPH